ncbi:hypothetical protein [Acidipila sp. EB88]|uniref:hypothetical protein n=1 Tax=Acidipila sp. EB88 TaxID=2305226 RepID=UPI000F6042B8|nr:hypothetical protein [Acidipila sp. EB88]RRA48315.1 hypothetical protein D1Y84_08465 [Acidipila sp. EB88]
MATTTATSSVPAIPVSTVIDNSFKLQNASKTIQVVYMPRHGGPVVVNTTANGASLSYTGPEGSFTFKDGQITTDTTAIGTLVTVLLNTVPDLRTLSFSLLVPIVRSNTGAPSQEVQTLAIKATHHLTLRGQPLAGADFTYQEMTMTGTARAVELAD